MGTLIVPFVSNETPADKSEYSDYLYTIALTTIAYGDINGNGAPTLTQDDSSTLPTIATYNQYKNILLVGADAYSRITDWSDRNCIFFGDGAGAVIIDGIGNCEVFAFVADVAGVTAVAGFP